VNNIVRQAGHIDVLVNNAGFGLFGAVEETTLAEARGQLESKFLGGCTPHGVKCCRACATGGSEFNVTSVLGFMPVPIHAYYGASKHALEGYSEVLALEVRSFGIFVEPSWSRSRLRTMQRGEEVT
jgi:short-subunit dehydrogenase